MSSRTGGNTADQVPGLGLPRPSRRTGVHQRPERLRLPVRWATGTAVLKPFADVQIFLPTTSGHHLVFPGQATLLRHGYWKDHWDMNSLVSFAPPNYFENLANGDTSWAFDATDLVRQRPSTAPAKARRTNTPPDPPGEASCTAAHRGLRTEGAVEGYLHPRYC